MSMPFYVSPEQLMKDRADYARKGIARGRSVVVLQYDDGILFVAENPSRALHKISEIYDRIAFAAVGRYNEFENLRIAGVRLADLRGYSYDRRDVTGRGLANAYAQTLGTIFSSGGEKPYEVEIVVAEVGDDRRGRPDLPAHLRRVGRRRARLRRHGRRGRQRRRRTSTSTTRDGMSLADAVRLAVDAARPHRGGRPRDPRRGPRGRGARPDPQPAAEVQAGHAGPPAATCSATGDPPSPTRSPRSSTRSRPRGPRARPRSRRPTTTPSRRSRRRAELRRRPAGLASLQRRQRPGYPLERVSRRRHTGRSTASEVGCGTAPAATSRVRETSGRMTR